MFPLFGPVPGGMELMVILLIAVVLFGLPLLLLGGLFFGYRRSKSDDPADDELRALRREVGRLREDIARLEDEEENERERGTETEEKTGRE